MRRPAPRGSPTRAVCDFGLARHFGSLAPKDMTPETGTYRWMAPEVISHSPYGHKVDVYRRALVRLSPSVRR